MVENERVVFLMPDEHVKIMTMAMTWKVMLLLNWMVVLEVMMKKAVALVLAMMLTDVVADVQ